MSVFGVGGANSSLSNEIESMHSNESMAVVVVMVIMMVVLKMVILQLLMTVRSL